MITDAAKKFADWLISESQKYDQYANIHAVAYAKSDNPIDKASFERCAGFSDIYRSIHREACAAMHAIEDEMKKGSQQ